MPARILLSSFKRKANANIIDLMLTEQERIAQSLVPIAVLGSAAAADYLGFLVQQVVTASTLKPPL